MSRAWSASEQRQQEALQSWKKYNDAGLKHMEGIDTQSILLIFFNFFLLQIEGKADKAEMMFIMAMREAGQNLPAHRSLRYHYFSALSFVHFMDLYMCR
jgi:hypothetical protein